MGFCSHFCGFYCVVWVSALFLFWVVGCVVQTGGGGLNGLALIETVGCFCFRTLEINANLQFISI